MEIPVQLQKLLEDLADKKVSVYTRLHTRQRVAGISQALNKAIIDFDKEYDNATNKRPR